MHSPHSPQGYVDLLVTAFRRQKLFPQGDVHVLMLGSLTGTQDAVQSNELTGEVFRFVKVDVNEPWFNTRTNEQASDDEMAELSIPAHLHAHMQCIHFVFYPRDHQLWFISRDGKNRMGAKRAEVFFQKMLDEASSALDGQQVEVTALPDPITLETMLSMHQLSKIVMQFKRPNPDDAEEIAGRIMQRMQQQNVKTINEELIAPRGQSIAPDSLTRAEARVAASNGHVEVIGKDADGNPVNESTNNKPMRLLMKVNSAIETVRDVLRRAKAAS